MGKALRDAPENSMQQPSGIVSIKIDINPEPQGDWRYKDEGDRWRGDAPRLERIGQDAANFGTESSVPSARTPGLRGCFLHENRPTIEA